MIPYAPMIERISPEELRLPNTPYSERGGDRLGLRKLLKYGAIGLGVGVLVGMGLVIAALPLSAEAISLTPLAGGALGAFFGVAAVGLKYSRRL